MVDVVKVKLAIDILRIHIESKRNYIHIAGSLTVAEKSSLYTLGTCKKTELGSCDRSTAVIVRMEADYGAVTVFKGDGRNILSDRHNRSACCPQRLKEG